MSDTPRTDDRTVVIDGNPWVNAPFARELERELNAANQRIKRLEEAGDAMMRAWLMPEDSMEYSDWIDLCCDARRGWRKAKDHTP